MQSTLVLCNDRTERDAEVCTLLVHTARNDGCNSYEPAVPYTRILCVLVLSAGCSGNLREKPGQSELDASVLQTIDPPPCAQPMTPTDGTGDCTGGGSAGDDCLMCHHQGGGATPFTFAGTLYDAAGSNAVAGATIYLQDQVGNIATAVTHGQGNFFSTDGFVMYPAKAFASLCPDVIGMVSPVDMTTGANCNTAGCHTRGFRVHVP